MKRLARVLAAGLLLAGPAVADPATGLWKTAPGDDGAFAHVRIYSCAPHLCGVITAAFDRAGAPVESDTVGKRMIWDMIPEGSGGYGGGKIWAPDRDKVYRAQMALQGNRLTIEGCILGGLACRGQDWTRLR